MTKREMFRELRDMVSENEEMVAFIDHEIELLDRKTTTPRKPTKVQTENEGFKAEIVAALATADEPVTIKGLCAICESISGLTNQRVTHLLTDLRKDGKVARTYVKKVAYFTLGDENEGE